MYASMFFASISPAARGGGSVGAAVGPAAPSPAPRAAPERRAEPRVPCLVRIKGAFQRSSALTGCGSSPRVPHRRLAALGARGRFRTARLCNGLRGLPASGVPRPVPSAGRSWC